MKHLCIALVRFYQKFLSPLKRHPTCRFYPTCSAYAIEAFQKRGFFAGMILTVYRILRCNPFCAPGYDPVPEHGFRHHSAPFPSDDVPDGDEPAQDGESDPGSGVLKYRKNDPSNVHTSDGGH